MPEDLIAQPNPAPNYIRKLGTDRCFARFDMGILMGIAARLLVEHHSRIGIQNLLQTGTRLLCRQPYENFVDTDSCVRKPLDIVRMPTSNPKSRPWHNHILQFNRKRILG